MAVNITPTELEIVAVESNAGGRQQEKLEANAEVNYWSGGERQRMYINEVVRGDLYFDFGTSEVVCDASYREASHSLSAEGIMTITVRYVRGDTDRMDAVVKVAMNKEAARNARADGEDEPEEIEIEDDGAEDTETTGTEIETETDSEKVTQTCPVCNNKIHGEKEWKEDAWMHPGCARRVGMGALGEFNSGERDFARRHLG